jgi:uncharacterized protein
VALKEDFSPTRTRAERRERGALDLPPFVARAPWWGGDLQTVRNFLMRRRPRQARPPERLVLPLPDGDRLAAALDRPLEADDRLPLVVLIHGLTGSEDSAYMRVSAAHLGEHGYTVVRLNLRGAGQSQPMCRWRYHAGRTEDLAAALAGLPDALTGNGVVAVGYSLGGNMLLKFAGERGSSAPLRAAVAVSAPLDLSGTAQRMMRPRNALYQRYLLGELKREALAPSAELTAAERAAIGRARTVWQFDEEFVAPRHDFAGAEDYYAKNDARFFIAGIAVPTLLIHARDDPWIAPDPYLTLAGPSLTVLLPEGGGHVGFHCAGTAVPWHHLAILRFLSRL